MAMWETDVGDKTQVRRSMDVEHSTLLFLYLLMDLGCPLYLV